MSCTFINKYTDKLFLDNMNMFDQKALDRHMESCPECREKFDKVCEHDNIIREAASSENVPPYLVLNVMRGIENGKLKRHKLSMPGVLAAAAVFVSAVLLSIYLILPLNNSITPANPNPGQAEPAAPQINSYTEDPAAALVLKEYAVQQFAIASCGGHPFVSIDIFGIEKSGDKAYAYMWVLMDEYKPDGGTFDRLSSLSIPVAVELKVDGGSYTVVSHKIPKDVPQKIDYENNIRAIFPEKYQEKIINYETQDYETGIGALANSNAKQAIEYFREPIANYSLDLTPELFNVYQRFSKDKSDETLTGLTPYDIYRLFFYASQKEDWETVYALYYKDGAALPSFDKFVDDIKKGIPYSNSDLIKTFNEYVGGAYIIYDNESKCQINIILKSGRPLFEGRDIYFNFKRAENKVWKLQFGIMQLVFTEG